MAVLDVSVSVNCVKYVVEVDLLVRVDIRVGLYAARAYA